MDPAALLFQLQDQGLCFGVTPEGRLQVGPRALLTPERRDLIQTHRAGLIEALALLEDAAEFYEERAGILEHEAGFTRKETEQEAARLTVVRFRLHDGPDRGGSVIAHGTTAAEIIEELRLRYGARLAGIEIGGNQNEKETAQTTPPENSPTKS